MSAYTSYFLNSASNIVELECLVISHSNFSQTYYIVRNNRLGCTVTHEDSTVHTYTYAPLSIKRKASLNNLDAGLTVNLGDLGTILPLEIARIKAAGNFIEKPTVQFRLYRSDVLTSPMFGPNNLEVTTLAQKREGAAFDADAPSLNINQTGELYDVVRFDMLRGGL